MRGPLISLAWKHSIRRVSYYEFSCLLWNTQFQCRVCSDPQLDWTLREMNLGGTLILSFLIRYYNIFLPSKTKSLKWPLSFSTSSQYSTCIPDARFQAPAASWTLRIGPIVCPGTSVRNYHHSLCDNPEEHSTPVSLMSAVCVTFSIHLILPYYSALLKFCVHKNGNYGGHRATLYIFLLLFLP